MKKFTDILKYTTFLAAGIFLFWFIYRDQDLNELKKVFRELEYKWLIVSILLGILSHVSRALRWNMLIKPLGYKPKIYNSFLAVLVLYLVNLIIPRAGEIARCTVLTKYEKIPTSKLFGTVVTERIIDTLTLLGIAVIIVFTNLDIFQRFFNAHPEMQEKLFTLFTLRNLFIVLFTVLIFIGFLIYLNKKHRENKVFTKLRKIKNDLTEGLLSIKEVKNKGLFVGYTLFIFLMWLMMLYVVFWAYEPTEHLSLKVGSIAFLMGGLAMLAPVQGGIGPWHFMVIETLFLYGISRSEGSIFALVAHSSTNLIYLVIGTIALIILPLVNLKYKPVKKE